MDKERQIRFLYPPLLLLSSFLFGAYLDKSFSLDSLIKQLIASDNSTSIVVALLGASSLVLVSGFLIGTITILILRIICFKNKYIYEVWLKPSSYDKIGNLILKKETDKIRQKDQVYAGITFDHFYIPPEIHQWCARRWNSFFVSANSALALIISLISLAVLGVHFSWLFFLTVILFILLFMYNSRLAWKESMEMIEFQIRVKNPKETANPNPETNSQIPEEKT